MNINSITSASVAAAVWAAAGRNLNNTSNSINSVSSRPSIGSNGWADLRATAGCVRRITVACVTPGTALQTFGVWDGTNLDAFETISATNCVKSGFCTPSCGLLYKNGSAGALTINCCGFEYPF